MKCCRTHHTRRVSNRLHRISPFPAIAAAKAAASREAALAAMAPPGAHISELYTPFPASHQAPHAAAPQIQSSLLGRAGRGRRCAHTAAARHAAPSLPNAPLVGDGHGNGHTTACAVRAPPRRGCSGGFECFAGRVNAEVLQQAPAIGRQQTRAKPAMAVPAT